MSTNLSRTALGEFGKKIEVPKYDARSASHGIVHVGVGGFHRAHLASYMHELFNQGHDLSWSIKGVGLLPHDKKIADTLASQDYLYTLLERAGDEEVARVVGSIGGFLHAPGREAELLDLLSAKTTKIVSLTITEGGYCMDPVTGELDTKHPGIAADISGTNPPQTIFGYIFESLKRRMNEGTGPYTVLSCDNLQENGKVTQRIVLGLAERRDPKVAKWIKENVTFPCCMVDRITPMTSPEDIKHVSSAYGINDSWPVVCESFRQWVVEDNFCAGRPRWEDVGVQLTKDVAPYELMKLRLLNASHSAMGYLGYLAGFRNIDDVALDPEFSAYVKNMMDLEVTPLLKPVPGVDLNLYKATLLRRFSNKAIRDQVLRICMDGSGKLPKFILPSISDQLKKDNNFKRLSLCIASWIRFLSGKDESGAEIPVNDPMADILKEKAAISQKDPSPFLGLTSIFGDLGNNAAFKKEVSDALKSLHEKGARATLKLYI